MKLKDIKQNLKAEHDKNAVPDVYARAKKAPLNKLLTGETPQKAFQQKLVMRLLTVVLLLFVVTAITIGALWVSPSDTVQTECYVRVRVEHEDGSASQYGIIMKGTKSTTLIALETDRGTNLTKPTKAYKSQIEDFISLNSGDKVRVDALSTNSAFAYDAGRFVLQSLLSSEPIAQALTSPVINSSTALAQWRDYVISCGGNLTSSSTLHEVYQEYLSL